MTDPDTWRRCSACKKPIALGAEHWVCSVSTCNRKRTGLVFCSVSCWEVHLPTAHHREAWAVEKTAPRSREPDEKAPSQSQSTPGAKTGMRRLVRPQAAAPDPASREVLIVASRLKSYVRARAGYNTSERVLGPLSDIVRRVCDQAIENARREGRMTVLDRDIPEL